MVDNRGILSLVKPHLPDIYTPKKKRWRTSVPTSFFIWINWHELRSATLMLYDVYLNDIAIIDI